MIHQDFLNWTSFFYSHLKMVFLGYIWRTGQLDASGRLPAYTSMLAYAGHQEIPCVYSLHKMSDTFQVPRPPSSGSISCQLCFILDYTANMKTQISQTKDAWRFYLKAESPRNPKKSTEDPLTHFAAFCRKI